MCATNMRRHHPTVRRERHFAAHSRHLRCHTTIHLMRYWIDAPDVTSCKYGRGDAESFAVAQQAITVPRDRGVDGVLLSCTENPLAASSGRGFGRKRDRQ